MYSRSGLNGKQIVIFVRAFTASTAQAEALKQARQQFTNGPVTIISVKEV